MTTSFKFSNCLYLLLLTIAALLLLFALVNLKFKVEFFFPVYVFFSLPLFFLIASPFLVSSETSCFAFLFFMLIPFFFCEFLIFLFSVWLYSFAGRRGQRGALNFGYVVWLSFVREYKIKL